MGKNNKGGQFTLGPEKGATRGPEIDGQLRSEWCSWGGSQRPWGTAPWTRGLTIPDDQLSWHMTRSTQSDVVNGFHLPRAVQFSSSVASITSSFPQLYRPWHCKLPFHWPTLYSEMYTFWRFWSTVWACGVTQWQSWMYNITTTTVILDGEYI